MKRENKSYEIKKIYPILFWHYCELCNRNFKKEHGWKIRMPYATFKYVCCDCCPTQKDLEKYIYIDYGLISK